MAENYYTGGPLDTGGAYAKSRGGFDGAIGFVDGIAGVVGGIGNITTGAADIREELARGQSAADKARLDREQREQAILLENFKVKRGDNVQLYYVLGAAALAVVVLMK